MVVYLVQEKVDGIFCILESKTETETFICHLNNQHPNI